VCVHVGRILVAEKGVRGKGRQLRKVLGIELGILQQRILNSATTTPFVFSLTEPAKDYLLCEVTDVKYGARHLKRAIDHALVYPMSNLIATQQVRTGDLIKVDFDPETNQMTFAKEAAASAQARCNYSIGIDFGGGWAYARRRWRRRGGFYGRAEN
jgi:hypothetical protein